MSVEDDVKKLREDFEAHKALQDASPIGCILYITMCLVAFLYFSDLRWGLGIVAVWNYLFS